LLTGTHLREQHAYAHPAYAQALFEFGKPVLLEQCGGWLLERPIPGSDARDAMGCYPLFSCRDWSGLAADLAGLAGALVTASLVADPFGPCDTRELSQVFDVVRPMKEHYIVDLSRPIEAIASKHHRYSVRRAFASVSVSLSHDPSAQLDDWLRLYGTLSRRKGLRGIRAFSPESFRRQHGVPGTTLFTAVVHAKTVGAHWFYVDGGVAYSHLAAFDEEGYRVGASYALQWAAIEHLSGVAAWLDLGGAPGTSDSAEHGLASFKRGWSTHRARAHLCGRILDPDRYASLSKDCERDDYFPSYRRGEFP
jgi:hypothetical protein